jgi:hypothetical protein
MSSVHLCEDTESFHNKVCRDLLNLCLYKLTLCPF